MRSVARAQTGFTLVEMMIVLCVIAILTSLFAQNAQQAVEETRTVACEKNRQLYEETETRFVHDHGRPTFDLEELVEAKYVNKVSCPRGGLLTWLVLDDSLPDARRELVCSIHGRRIRMLRDGRQDEAEEDPAAAPADAQGAAPADEPAGVPGGPLGGGTLVSDGFDGPVPSGWTDSKGSYWEVRDGRYYAGRDGRSGGLHVGLTGDTSWTDYTYSSDVRLESGNGFGMYFRVTDPKKPDGYLLQFNGNNNELSVRLVNNGKTGTKLESVKLDKGTNWSGKDLNVQITVKGPSFSVAVNGTTYLNGSDSTHSQGAVGVGTWGKGYASFDNVRVSAP